MVKKNVLLASSNKSPLENRKRRLVVLPGEPSKDFIVNSPCRIVGVGGRIGISAADLPGDSGGIYTWSTKSTKIRLINSTGATVALEAMAQPGAGRDSEVIEVTRTGSDGSKKTKTVTITVVRVRLGLAATQLYGYDDFDTPAVWDDDQICVKSAHITFVEVTIEGGAVGTDLVFECRDASVCTAELALPTARFDLQLRAKPLEKKSTVLEAKTSCPSAAVLAKINVHVYAETVVKLVIAKVADSSSAATALNFPNADYLSHQSIANNKLKEAVVRFAYRNMEPTNSVMNIAFDSNASGTLDFDINARGGGEVQKIDDALTWGDDEVRIVIVRKMRSLYFLAQAAKVGDTSITVRGANVFISTMLLGTGSTQETITVTSNEGNIGTLAAPLKFHHPVGDIMEFPAAAWGGTPIIIAEGADTMEIVKWTILHEVGHVALGLMDVLDPESAMNESQDNSDYRFRYCPRNSAYKPGEKENQWDTIPRTVTPPHE